MDAIFGRQPGKSGGGGSDPDALEWWEDMTAEDEDKHGVGVVEGDDDLAGAVAAIAEQIDREGSVGTDG